MNLMQTIRRIGQQMNGWKNQYANLSAQLPLIKKLYEKYGLELKMTCGACPEQYEVFKDGSQVAYFRLRHGEFTVHYTDCGGETIYQADPKGDGAFDNDERLVYMNHALKAVLKKLNI